MDGAFAGHTDAEQRIWLRSQMWVSEHGTIGVTLDSPKVYISQQIYVTGVPSGRVGKAKEVEVQCRRAGQGESAWKPVGKTNKWTGVWLAKIPGQYEFRVRAKVLGEWVNSSTAKLEVAKPVLVLSVSGTRAAVVETLEVRARLEPSWLASEPAEFWAIEEESGVRKDLEKGYAVGFTGEKIGSYTIEAKMQVGTWGITAKPVKVKVDVLEDWLAKLKRLSKQALSAAVKGDFSGEDNGVVGMLVTTAGGFIPIVGQIADIRDTVAAMSQMKSGGWKEGGNWAGLGASIVGFIPGMDWVKGANKAAKKAAKEAIQSAEKKSSKEIAAVAVAEAEKMARRLATGPDEAVFWSAIRSGDTAAAKWAAQNRGTTLEATLAARGVNLPTWNPNNPASVAAWKQASKHFAAGASGNVRVLQTDAVRINSIWAEVEFPTLKSNPNINSIKTINPETGAETLLWSR